jgi:hypothetical protein
MRVVRGEPTDAEIGKLWRAKHPEETMENLEKWVADGFLKVDLDGKIAPR